jgi:hypothetical protein
LEQLGKRDRESGGQIGPVRVGLASCGLWALGLERTPIPYTILQNGLFTPWQLHTDCWLLRNAAVNDCLKRVRFVINDSCLLVSQLHGKIERLDGLAVLRLVVRKNNDFTMHLIKI